MNLEFGTGEMSDLENKLSAIDSACDLDRQPDRCAQFMIASCKLVKAYLPDLGLRALDVAESYWAGRSGSDELATVRVKCWEYLNALKAAGAGESKEFKALRAVLMVLYPDGEDLLDVLATIVVILNQVEDHGPEQSSLLQEIFPLECGGRSTDE